MNKYEKLQNMTETKNEYFEGLIGKSMIRKNDLFGVNLPEGQQDSASGDNLLCGEHLTPEQGSKLEKQAILLLSNHQNVTQNKNGESISKIHLLGKTGDKSSRRQTLFVNPNERERNSQQDIMNNYLLELWEVTFGCTWKLESNRPCSGHESLNNMYSPFTDISQLRHAYNTYVAVYTVAHALNDLQNCVPSRGPFENRSCTGITNFEHWQVRTLPEMLIEIICLFQVQIAMCMHAALLYHVHE